MNTKAFFPLFILILLCGVTPVNALENINAPGSAPLFSSYIAAYEHSSYFVDEGYHLVYYTDGEPIKLINESSGEFSLAFQLGDVVTYTISDFYKKPVVTLSYPDSFRLEAEPFVGVRIVLDFALHTSAGATGDIRYKNQTNEEAMIYFIYGNTFQKVRCTAVEPEKGLTIAYTEPGKGKYFQQDALAGFNENRQCLFRFNQPLYAWGGYQVYNKNMTSADVAARYQYLNGSLSGELSEWAVSFKLRQKNGSLKFAKVTAQEGQKNEKTDLAAVADGLLKADFEEILRFNREKLGNIPAVNFRDNDEKLLYYGGLYLGRQQFYPAAGQFPYPYYVFSREPTWGWGHEGQVFHESLSMHSLALFDPLLAMQSQRNFMAVQEKDGYMPYRVGAYFTRTFPANGEKTTSAPYFCWTNLEVYQLAVRSRRVDQKQLDLFLADSYNAGKKFMTYLLASRDKNKNGLLEWGGHTLLECVRDYLNAVFDLLGDAPETLNQLEALDLSCMAVKEMKALSSMAELLGKKQEAGEWTQKAETMSGLINRYMWDEDTGFYYHVHKDTMNFQTPAGVSLKRKEIIGFLPIWAGVAGKDRAETLVSHLHNPDEFGRKFGIPTLSAADPYYSAQVLECCRWNGPVWITWVYPVFKGLLDYGYTDQAEEALMKIEEAMMFQLRRNHRLWESYSPDFTQLNSPRNYIWDTLISRMIYEIRQ